MKAIMLSIQPKWCELIASDKKTVEVRKNKPKLDTPFKVYIYCTANKQGVNDLLEIHGTDGKIRKANSKVIGEFVCNKIEVIKQREVFNADVLCSTTCLTIKEFLDYIGNATAYLWHISNLVIYDKPKELSEFYRLGEPLICDGRNCEICNHFKYMQVNSDEWDYDCDCQHQLENRITLKRPPQSWCYVEEIKE